MKIDIVAGSYRINARRVRAVVSRVLKKKPVHGTVIITFISAQEIKRINRQFRKKSYATDVLSFRYDEAGIWGEVVICHEVARRDARELGISLQDEIDVLLVHGLLHLSGYDHERSADAKRMEFMERRMHRRIQLA